MNSSLPQKIVDVRFHDYELPLFFSAIPASVQLAKEEVHLWFGSSSLGENSFDAEEMTAVTAEQKIKASLFRNRERKREYLYLRNHLNNILSKYTGIPPNLLHYHVNQSGKPFLENSKDLFFNLTHSANLFIIAVAGNSIGVDMEFVTRRVTEMREIMRRYYHRDEFKAVAERNFSPHSFLTIWTRKEAVLKAVGVGLHELANTINTCNQATISQGYHVYSSRFGDFVFSFAVERPFSSLKFFKLSSQI